jgi:hypothetical protein
LLREPTTTLAPCRQHRRRRRGVGPIGIKEHRHLERSEERLLDLFQHGFRVRHIRPTDKNRRRGQVGRTPGKEGTVNQIPHVARRDGAVAKQVLDAGVDGHDSVKNTRLRVGVELNQDLRFHGSWSISRRMGA